LLRPPIRESPAMAKRTSEQARAIRRPRNPAHPSVWQEFIWQQLPILALVLAAGVATAYVEYGYIPNGDRPFLTAGVRVTVWHLIIMGVWTGYTMALVGQAAGIFALPYSTSVLQFTNPHVSPTMLVLTSISPIGALLGFRRSGQWNLNFAIAVCLGGAVGGLIGPFFRATVLANANTFRFTLGVALALFGIQLCWKAIRDYLMFGSRAGHHLITVAAHDPEPKRFNIQTVQRTFTVTRIRFGAQHRDLPNIELFAIGTVIGAFSAALGVGGGFLLVPVFSMVYRLPLYVMVAATIPYTIILSVVGIVTFTFILPVFGTAAIAPEWSWGLFTAAGGLFGSWGASKTQLFMPEHLLNWLLGGVTALLGALYITSFFVKLPFAL
jgi:uncharacterized membrane protein YfcA